MTDLRSSNEINDESPAGGGFPGVRRYDQVFSSRGHTIAFKSRDTTLLITHYTLLLTAYLAKEDFLGPSDSHAMFDATRTTTHGTALYRLNNPPHPH